MKNALTYIFLLVLMCSEAFSADLVASDVNPNNAIQQIGLIVGSLVAFLAFLMGSKRLLKFLG